MSCDQANMYRTVKPVTISYSDLKDKGKDLSSKIEEAFGPEGLGVISISDVPEFSFLRRNLLHLSPILASLPDDVKVSLEDPVSRYSFGWFHGNEKLESAKLDAFKGCFSANPIIDVPTTDVSLMQRYSSFCRPNKWPTTALPELEVAFKALGQLILDVGLMVACHCDKYVLKAADLDEDDSLEKLIKHSRCHKARLLYYFPKHRSQCADDNNTISSWAGWHTDFGCLTGLTCGMFSRNAEEIACPDSVAGLYVKAQNNEVVRVAIGEDELAYQIGETAEILSGHRLCATPHCVRAPSMDKAIGVARSTFVMFMQPNWDKNLRLPSESGHHPEAITQSATITFGDYSNKVLSKYY